jgi:hypothetical protein
MPKVVVSSRDLPLTTVAGRTDQKVERWSCYRQPDHKPPG